MPSSLDLRTNFEGQLRICNLIMTPIDSDVLLTNVHIGETFNVCVVLDLTEVKRSAGVPLSYAATIRAKKLGEKSRQIAGTRQGIMAPGEKASCTVEVTLASQGIYRLEAIVTLTQADKPLMPQHRLMAMGTSSLLQVY